MLNLTFRQDDRSPFRVLCLGAHADDLEIGCGGTVLTLIAAHPRAEIDWVVFSASDRRLAEAHAGAAEFLEGAAHASVSIESYRDGFFPYRAYEIKEHFESLKRRCAPDLIFTHYRDDRHQDHRLISELTWNTFRDHLILEYEIPKYDGDLGSPNVFVPLDGPTCHRKVRAITGTFLSQQDRHWFTDDTFLALMRLRGIEAASPSGYAEGFFCRKASVTLAPARELAASERVDREADAVPAGSPTLSAAPAAPEGSMRWRW